MEKVCDDSDNTEWFFDCGVYFCKSADGSILGKVKGEFLPNPILLHQRRLETFGQSTDLNLRPSDATYYLWAHHERNSAHA